MVHIVTNSTSAESYKTQERLSHLQNKLHFSPVPDNPKSGWVWWRVRRKSHLSAQSISMCRKSSLFHPIAWHHPNFQLPLEIWNFTETQSFSIWKAVDLRTMFWPNDICGVLLRKEKTTHRRHSLWMKIFYSIFICLAGSFSRATCTQECCFATATLLFPPSCERMTYLTQFLDK